MNPLNYLRNQSWFRRPEPQPVQPQFPEITETQLQDLPIEVRVDIWSYLDFKDYKAIRQQCKQFRWEIDQIAGVQAIVTGPKKFSFWWPNLRANPEIKRVEDNLNWVSNSVVRGLNLSRLSELTLDPKTLINNTHILHRLRIELDDDFKLKPKVMEILDTCNNLRLIDITCRRTANRRFNETYRNEANIFHQEILQKLQTKPHLKNLSICVKPGRSFAAEFAFQSFPGAIEDSAQAPPNYPSKIQFLKIEAPILKNSDEDRLKFTVWKTFIDKQGALSELDLNLCFVHWTFFNNVIQKNQETLTKLTLFLSNWQVPRTAVNWRDMVPVNQHLDWTQLLPNPAQLTSLKVAMSSGYLTWVGADFAPNSTRNFVNLNLDSLTKLELRSVFLTAADFNKIFGLPRLTHVNLKHWSTVGQPDAQLTAIGFSTFQSLFRALLTSNRLEKIAMMDFSVNKCPKYLQELIKALPNYKTLWSLFGCYKSFQYAGHEIRFLALCELLITRNPANQLLPALFTAG